MLRFFRCHTENAPQTATKLEAFLRPVQIIAWCLEASTRGGQDIDVPGRSDTTGRPNTIDTVGIRIRHDRGTVPFLTPGAKIQTPH